MVRRHRVVKIQTVLFVSPAMLLLICVASVKAQSSQLPKPPTITADKQSSREDDSPLTTFEEEIKAKRLIKLAEKEHEDNLKRAREISQIGQDLKANLANPPVAARLDPKKVDRLEKLTKKIRGEAGGEDDDVQIVDVPVDLPTAVSKIADTADQLSKDVQKTPRQVVSAAVIDRANVLLQLIKTLRGFLR